MSIRLRLTLWYSGLLAAVLLLFGSIIYALVYHYAYQDVENEILRQTSSLSKKMAVVVVPNSDFTEELNLLLPEEANQLADLQIYVQLYNYENNKVVTSKNLNNFNFEVPATIQEAMENEGWKRMLVDKTPFLVYQFPFTYTIQGTTEQVSGLLQVGSITASEDKLMDRLLFIMVYVSIITIMLAMSVGLFLARKSMRPLVDIINAANGIQSGNDLSVRIEYDGPQDEIGKLIGTVNKMLARTEGFFKELEDAYAAQRRFVSDASHELRTPLTTIRGNTDFLKKLWDPEADGSKQMSDEMRKEITLEAIDDISDEGKRMSRLVNDMLSLARADTGQTIELHPIPLSILVKEVARRAHHLERTAEWSYGDLEVLNGVYVLGNKDYLQQMLFIFIENAFKYTPEGTVTLDAVVYNGQVGLKISDTGIGMDKDEVPYIFDRFYRADESRGVTKGTGLGLSIAKWIIEEHGGSVEVLTKLNEGTTFIIWLPLVLAPPLE
ncbi:HAMP domain-containing sensor histidine kinase [Paenibacillus polygoni]|uniref:histidine kinase n=1 Tax=Paenibacillus polygoni TaxID=3050112 RepID=A0ABY8X4S0_9BACL|nr:HAMP domain-containing sensor histidine kinase [Paenibacillus polygoni]WIV20492.1 HAMP domain-containing sensor histidine kinase [Paenibacillus polygoni]